MSTTKAESNRQKFTNEAYELQKEFRSIVGSSASGKNSPMLAQSEVDAMLGGFDFAGLEPSAPVKTVASLPKVEIKTAPEPARTSVAQLAPVETVVAAAPEPVTEVQAPSTEDGHSFAHYFQQRDEQPAASNRGGSVEMFA